jgi:hypothetical protein
LANRRPPGDRVQPGGKFRVLGGDAGGIAAVLEVVVEPGCGVERGVFGSVAGVVVAQGDQSGGANGHGVGTQSHGLGNVGAGTDAAGDDELDLAVDAEFLQCLDSLRDGGEGGDADVFDEYLLRRCRAALHTVNHHDVGT